MYLFLLFHIFITHETIIFYFLLTRWKECIQIYLVRCPVNTTEKYTVRNQQSKAKIHQYFHTFWCYVSEWIENRIITLNVLNMRQQNQIRVTQIKGIQEHIFECVSLALSHIISRIYVYSTFTILLLAFAKLRFEFLTIEMSLLILLDVLT